MRTALQTREQTCAANQVPFLCSESNCISILLCFVEATFPHTPLACQLKPNTILAGVEPPKALHAIVPQ
jgi:hypothetical protein